MVTDEEMKFRRLLQDHAASGADLQSLMQLASKYQGTNMESYPERYIPQQSKIFMGDPIANEKRFSQSGLGPTGASLLAKELIYGAVNTNRAPNNAYFSKSSHSDFALPHELEHVAQQNVKRPNYQSGFKRGLEAPLSELDRYNQAKSMSSDFSKSKGYDAHNVDELWAHLSALEANAPVGTSWDKTIPWNKSNLTSENVNYYNQKRRPDLQEPLSPLPHPDVKQWGDTSSPPGILQQLLQYFNRFKPQGQTPMPNINGNPVPNSNPSTPLPSSGGVRGLAPMPNEDTQKPPYRWQWSGEGAVGRHILPDNYAVAQPKQPSILERLLNRWQEGARAPDSQQYDPRTYTPPPNRGMPTNRLGGGTR